LRKATSFFFARVNHRPQWEGKSRPNSDVKQLPVSKSVKNNKAVSHVSRLAALMRAP